jgi:D-aminoacyl-tRNA deacylase
VPLARYGEGQPPELLPRSIPRPAEALYEAFCDALEAEGVGVSRDVLGARMEVELINDGPVTIVLEG